MDFIKFDELIYNNVNNTFTKKGQMACQPSSLLISLHIVAEPCSWQCYAQWFFFPWYAKGILLHDVDFSVLCYCKISKIPYFPQLYICYLHVSIVAVLIFPNRTNHFSKYQQQNIFLPVHLFEIIFCLCNIGLLFYTFPI